MTWLLPVPLVTSPQFKRISTLSIRCETRKKPLLFSEEAIQTGAKFGNLAICQHMIANFIAEQSNSVRLLIQ